jgi:hypothetical protein
MIGFIHVAVIGMSVHAYTHTQRTYMPAFVWKVESIKGTVMTEKQSNAEF